MSRRAGHEDDPTPLGDAVARLQAELGVPGTDAVDALSDRWAEVVGARLAPHTRLGSVRDGVMTVIADPGPAASMLERSQAEVIRAAAAVAGAGVVRALRVRVRPAS